MVHAGATRRSIEGTAIGNFMEAYDFTLFSLVATILAQKFYPGENSGAGNLIATFGTMTAGFVVRPLGGFIFGPLGDRIGRKPVLVMTISLMAVCAAATGVLPVYHTIGVWAPILLTVIRIGQGLSSGGEYAGAMTFIAEHAPDHKRGMLAGFLPVGTLGGFVVGAALVTGLQTALPTGDMLAWGWRIPFLLAAPFGLVAVYLRSRIDESPDYEEIRAPAANLRPEAIHADGRAAMESAADLHRPGARDQRHQLHGQRVRADLPQEDGRRAGHPGVGDGPGAAGRVDGRRFVRRPAVRPHRRQTADVDGMRSPHRGLDTGV